MFIPYEVDAPFDRQPVVNWLVIVVVVLVFVIQIVTSERHAAEISKKGMGTPYTEDILKEPPVEKKKAAEQPEKKQTITGPMARFALNGWGLGLFTYIWLNGGILKGFVRLAGNLIFLWTFGNAICAKLGNKIYPLIFLGFGLLAGIIHIMLADRLAVGASAVICSIIGIYIVLYPEDTISCFVLLPRPMAVSISGGWVVGLWFIFDLLEAALGGQSTSYCAHVFCAAGGAGLAILMLKKKWLVMEKDEKSILQMLARVKEEETGKEEQGKGVEGEKKDTEAVEKQPTPSEKAKAEPAHVSNDSQHGHVISKQTLQGQKRVPHAEKPADDFIRFKCECGHRIKIHKKDAGKTGRCPKCSRWVEAPRQ